MNNIIVGDADSLVALVHPTDANHLKAKKLSENLLIKGYQIIYPNTAVIEAITTLKRALNLPDKAHLVNQRYLQGVFDIEYINEEIQQQASQIFEAKAVSKKNTLFDAVVVATAQKLESKSIFSFDKWYTKLGLKLV